MPSQPLNLTQHQQQVLDDLGVDAWYLQPIANKSNDTQQEAISDIVEALSASLQQTNNNASQAVYPPSLAPKEYPATVNSVANSALSVAANQPSALTIPDSIKNTNDNNQAIPSEANAKSESSSATSQQINNPLPPNIELVAIHSVPPADDHISFPKVERLAVSSWQGIDDALNQLNTKKNPTNHSEETDGRFGSGFGNKNAQWVFVMPPSQHDDSRQCLSLSSKLLMTEWLKSLGKSFEEVYVTPMIKQLMKIPRDPENEWLASHLSILLAEFELVKPKRIFLMGRLPCQKLLDSSAPLSELMKSSYGLNCPADICSDVMPLTCLPSLDYFCKLPSEKSWLWQVSKDFININ